MASLVAQWLKKKKKKKNLPTNAGNSGSIHWEDLQTEMATHCSILS